ncbi:type II secretion system F family protein [Luteimonas sp. 8-5]|uniref:type II secretion system F family protein n=1 Tax=Luteimonas sp. 8-5 TaxID=3039387 RepID=UPI00243741BC|nr:type II secretion system F family protein [Luteimonas sp. 8-5]MDG6348863.1 type II secretion system F family protein [Luteimonas sp. 8-5]
MEQFRYEALNAEGAVFTGAVRAATEREAARMLEKRGLSVVRLEAGAGVGKARRAGRLRTADVIMALQELATMLTSGVPIVDAVGSQAMSAHHPRIVEAFTAMSRDLQRGQAFSATLAASGLPLPDYVVQLARAGELTGELGQALADAGAQLEYEYNLRNEMRNALIYPAVLVVAGAGAVALMFLFVVPKFASLLERADDLPFLAWAVLGLGTWTNDNFVAIAALVALAVAAAVAALRRPQVRSGLLDRASHMPVVGAWLVESDTARWAKMLAALLANRVPLMRALELAQSGLQLPHRKARMGEVSRAVRGGRALSDALEEHDALTATGYNLVRVGERSGKLAPMLESLARIYAEAGRNRMKQVLILIEPIAILVIGGMIGTIILGVILAITSANDLAI